MSNTSASGCKEALRQAIITGLEQNLATAVQAANTARDTATSKESIAENKYDTFGLEASYLAHGQSQRVLDLQQEIDHYKSLVFKDFHSEDEIDLTCLVTLINEQDEYRVFFIGPAAGGMKLQWQQRELVLITPQTPLGQSIIGKQIGDEITLTQAGKQQRYEIIEIA